VAIKGVALDREKGFSRHDGTAVDRQPAHGFGQVALGANVPITVSGFKTPLTGAVNTQIGLVTYEGLPDSSGGAHTLRAGPHVK
jgi:hypothetical protein